jgi:general secretion pathway protein A
LYERYFGFTVKPFELLPDPDFLYLSRVHKRALTYLDYGIREHSGFILLTGEIGSGKTTLIRNLLKKKHEKVVVSKVFNTKVDAEQLVALINEDFGLAVDGKDKITLLRELNDFLIRQYAAGKQPVLIIDEAQNLSEALLEEIRLLSNLESEKSKLLQIILVGQPELRKTLSSESLIQLRQRISVHCRITSLNRAETEEYVLYRMEKAGNREAVQFDPAALEIVFEKSRGIPRLINIICDYLLLAAFAAQQRTVDETMVNEIIEDLDFENQYWSFDSDLRKDGDAHPVQERSGDHPGMDLRRMAMQLARIEEQVGSMGKCLDLTHRVEGLVKAMNFRLTGVSSHVAAVEKSVVAIQERLAQIGTAADELEAQSLEENTGTVKKSIFRRMLFL